jgi:hypothetical protein
MLLSPGYLGMIPAEEVWNMKRLFQGDGSAGGKKNAFAEMVGASRWLARPSASLKATDDPAGRPYPRRFTHGARQ